MTDITQLPDFEQFVEVQPGLYRCTIIWNIMVGVAVPVATFLIQGTDTAGNKTNEWILVDAGTPFDIPKLLKAIDTLFASDPKNTLAFICITHGHIDHTGATLTLLEKYPAAKVVMHVEEKPFICDGKSFKECAGDTWSFTLLKPLSHESLIRVPAERSVTLHDGDKWEFEHVIRFIETPGHTPGSASYLHIPSRSLMVGDAVMHIAANPMLSKIPCISGPMPMSTCHWGNAMKAITKITQQTEHVDWVLPAHDYSPNGLKIQQVADFHCPSTAPSTATKSFLSSWLKL